MHVKRFDAIVSKLPPKSVAYVLATKALQENPSLTVVGNEESLVGKKVQIRTQGNVGSCCKPLETGYFQRRYLNSISLQSGLSDATEFYIGKHRVVIVTPVQE